MSAPQDRRGTPRYSVRLGAEIQYEGRFYTAMTRDLSAAGVSLEGDQAFEGGVQIHVSLFLVTEGIEDPSFPPLNLRGTVAWSHLGDGTGPAVTGVHFDGLTPQQAATLDRFIRAETER